MVSSARSGAPAKKKRRRWWRVALWALGIIVVLTAAGLVIVARSVKPILLGRLRQAFPEWDISVEDARIEGLFYRLVVIGLKVVDRRGTPEESTIRVEEVSVPLTLGLLRGRAIALDVVRPKAVLAVGAKRSRRGGFHRSACGSSSSS